MSFNMYTLPPEMYEFERDGLFLFYDPVNFVWFRTDAVGKTLIDTLARGGDGQEAAAEVARLSGASLEVASAYAAGALQKLLEMGFLHRGEYVRSPRISSFGGWAPLPAERIQECFSCPARHACPGGCRTLGGPEEDGARARGLCPVFYGIAIDRLWMSAAVS
ncbi:MAG TPA: hypothetical protein VHC97_19315 [Thermoanaerobaculia bacterium]|jgi:radical SAM protein with 4Fe4S-binding SPASM domain|nr:hypothetical protein [Thermoanaerobaculia bacterium]